MMLTLIQYCKVSSTARVLTRVLSQLNCACTHLPSRSPSLPFLVPLSRWFRPLMSTALCLCVRQLGPVLSFAVATEVTAWVWVGENMAGIRERRGGCGGMVIG
eukprot:1319866-Rhodomonas_salina.5